MAKIRKYKLSDTANAKSVDLRQYRDEIVSTAGKNVNFGRRRGGKKIDS